MTPEALGTQMVAAIPSKCYPFALICLAMDGTRVEVIVPQVYQRMLQHPGEREKIVQAFQAQLVILGQHPEDWNGRVRLT